MSGVYQFRSVWFQFKKRPLYVCVVGAVVAANHCLGQVLHLLLLLVQLLYYSGQFTDEIFIIVLLSLLAIIIVLMVLALDSQCVGAVLICSGVW